MKIEELKARQVQLEHIFKNNADEQLRLEGEFRANAKIIEAEEQEAQNKAASLPKVKEDVNGKAA